MMSTNIRIAICFFGITRALSLTCPSIEKKVISPARDIGEVRIFGHFFRQKLIFNPRSGEYNSHDPENHSQLKLDWVNIEEPDTFIDSAWFSRLKTFGDEYNDGFRSIRNLVHQLHSLQQVSRAAMSWGADIYVFVRPDLFYHDSFEKVLNKAARLTRDGIFIPSWANWGPGYNDRFCVCVGERAVRAYAERILHVENFCLKKGKLHAEKLVKYSVDSSGVKVKYFSVRGSRVRSNGKVVSENFQDFRWLRIKNKFKFFKMLWARF
jgi:hypothetical protein